MVSRRNIQLKDRTVLFSPDDPVPLVDRIQALVKLRVTDEITVDPVESAITIQVGERGFVPRVTSGGLAALVGIPRQLFPALQTTDYFVHVTLNADRYLSRGVAVNVPKDPAFPSSFSPPQLNIALHREPVFIAGRTVRSVGNGTAPVAGAIVSVTGIWRTVPPANVAVGAYSPDIVSIQPPLYSDRASGTQLMRRDLVPIAGSDKELMDNLLPGANPIRLSDRVGLLATDILLIDGEQPDLSEFIGIKALSPSGMPDPSSITLNYPVIFAHRRGAIVRKINPQPAGVPQQFTVEAWSGDTCVFLDGLTGLAAANQIQITGGPGPEYHNVTSFTVASDADGYYRLPPLSRIAQLELHAEKTVGTQTFKATTTFCPDYKHRNNRFDFMMAV